MNLADFRVSAVMCRRHIGETAADLSELFLGNSLALMAAAAGTDIIDHAHVPQTGSRSTGWLMEP